MPAPRGSQSVRRFWGALRFAQALASVYPGGEPPLPHGISTILVRNIPSAFSWALPPMRQLLPQSEASKVLLFATTLLPVTYRH